MQSFGFHFWPIQDRLLLAYLQRFALSCDVRGARLAALPRRKTENRVELLIVLVYFFVFATPDFFSSSRSVSMQDIEKVGVCYCWPTIFQNLFISRSRGLDVTTITPMRPPKSRELKSVLKNQGKLSHS